MSGNCSLQASNPSYKHYTYKSLLYRIFYGLIFYFWSRINSLLDIYHLAECNIGRVHLKQREISPWMTLCGHMFRKRIVTLREQQKFHEVTKGRFRQWPNFERRSVWTNENAEMSKVRPLGLHTRGQSPKDVASKRA